MAQVYRDGSGKPIPNEDEIIRAGLAAKLARKFSDLFSANPAEPRIEYTGNVRAGTVMYIEGDLRIEFWHEMGGGACHLFINIPPPDEWEAQTKTPLSRRDEIVHFVAHTVRHDQAPSWRYEIHENEIAYY